MGLSELFGLWLQKRLARHRTRARKLTGFSGACFSERTGRAKDFSGKGKKKIGKAEDYLGLFFLSPGLFFLPPGKAEDFSILFFLSPSKAEDFSGQIILSVA